MSKHSYDASAIEHLTFREGARKRIGIYLGSADMGGVTAGLLELVNNATDEALVHPSATLIEIEVGKDWASVRDYGRGIPRGPNKFSKEILIDLLTENHSGAKFDDLSYGGKSRGLNGSGAGATCVSSDWFEVHSYRDEAEWFLRFENGIPTRETAEKRPKGKTKGGTFIKYKPSQEVFNAEKIQFNYDEIAELMKEYSFFNKGVTFVVKNAETGEVRKFLSKNGMIDFAKERIKNPLHPTPIHYQGSKDGVDIEIILQWTKEKERFYLFSNGGENPYGGTPITGIKTALTREMKKSLSAQFNGDMVRSGLVYVCSVNLKDPIYDGQNKTRITNPELQSIAGAAIRDMLEDFKVRNEKEFNMIIEYLMREQKAELAAERARRQVRETVKDIERNQKKKVFASDKLKDAEFLGLDSKLLLVEGNSALASIMPARDHTKIGALALRGKMLNLFTANEEKTFQNEEIKLILSALNIVPGKYDAKKLRYGEVWITADGDSDGSHVGLLIASALWNLAPEFVKEGRLKWLRAPLYVADNKGKRTYYYTDEEFEKAKPKGQISRAKGLGSLSTEMMRESMMGDDKRLINLDYSNESFTLLAQLMGTDVEPRKDFIFSNVDFTRIHE